MSTVCPTCQGRGGRVLIACSHCHGTGREPSGRRVNVRIPAGVDDGQRIRLKGKGEPGVHGGPSGDLFVDVHVAHDELFARKGRHITTTVHVPVTEALLGTTVSVPTLDDPVIVKINAGTAPGTTMRVKGKGVPATGKHHAGDMLVTVQVDLPHKLTKHQKDLVEQLAASLGEESA
jgi:molecular chaperone DnaJ